jgi:hypothetical protein
LIRRFNATINFNRYSNDDLIEVASVITNYLLDKFKLSGRNTKLLKKNNKTYESYIISWGIKKSNKYKHCI